jgi:hypothetical protein
VSNDAAQSSLRAGGASVAAAALILALAMPLDAAGRRQDVLYAWWVTASFQPTGGEVEGIPVQMLDATWQRASVIRPSDLPAAAARPGERLEDFGVTLAVQADLDGDQRPERAIVGGPRRARSAAFYSSWERQMTAEGGSRGRCSP